MRMRISVTVLCVLTWAGQAAFGDEVRIGRLTYADVVVLDVKDWTISFRNVSGRVKAEPVVNVTGVRISGRKVLNKAEDLVQEAKKLAKRGKTAEAQQKYAEAIKTYDKAGKVRFNQHTFVRYIIVFRRLSAVDKCGWIDQAVSQWLVIADQAKGSRASVLLWPRRPAVKGDPRNAKAIGLLEARRNTITNKTYRSTVVQLLRELYDREGRADDVLKLAGDGDKPDESAGAKASEASRLTFGSAAGELLEIKALLTKKDYSTAAAKASSLLRTCGKDDLAAVLMLLGKAQLGRAASGGQRGKRRLMLRAGLNFMRVATHFRRSSNAAEALYLTATILQDLPGKPNTKAAARTYEAVARRHEGTPFAAKASEALETMRRDGN